MQGHPASEFALKMESNAACKIVKVYAMWNNLEQCDFNNNPIQFFKKALRT